MKRLKIIITPKGFKVNMPVPAETLLNILLTNALAVCKNFGISFDTANVAMHNFMYQGYIQEILPDMKDFEGDMGQLLKEMEAEAEKYPQLDFDAIKANMKSRVEESVKDDDPEAINV